MHRYKMHAPSQNVRTGRHDSLGTGGDERHSLRNLNAWPALETKVAITASMQVAIAASMQVARETVKAGISSARYKDGALLLRL